jgi:hypothetical protein
MMVDRESKRDIAAMVAMHALLCNHEITPIAVAEIAVNNANDLIAELERNPLPDPLPDPPPTT